MTSTTHFTEQDIICNDSSVQAILFYLGFYSTNEMVKFYFKINFTLPQPNRVHWTADCGIYGLKFKHGKKV